MTKSLEKLKKTLTFGHFGTIMPIMPMIIYHHTKKKDRQMDRQTDRQTGDRQTDNGSFIGPSDNQDPNLTHIYNIFDFQKSCRQKIPLQEVYLGWSTDTLSKPTK